MMTSVPTLERPETPSRSRYRYRSPSTARTRSKTLLFCSCGREAPTDEWCERDDSGRRIVCPDCGRTLTVR